MRFVVYEERDEHGFASSGLWRWKLLAKNGRNIANGGEGYDNLSNAKRACRRFSRIVTEAHYIPIEVSEA